MKKKNKNVKNSKPVAMIIIESVAGFFGLIGLAAMVLLLKMPNLVFSFIHYGWIIGIGIALFAASLAAGIIWLIKCPVKVIGISQITAGLCIAFLMIMGLCYSNVPTYYINSASDFAIFNNVPPQKNGYNVEFTEDIDCRGYDFKGGFGNDGVNFYINGNGHTVTNIEYTATLKKENTTFWHISQESVIKDLHFEGCVFNLTPDYFSNETHSGLSCNFYLLGNISTHQLVNFTLTETTVYVHKPPEDIRHSPSTLGNIYPADRKPAGDWDSRNFLIEITVIEAD